MYLASRQSPSSKLGGTEVTIIVLFFVVILVVIVFAVMWRRKQLQTGSLVNQI